MPHPRNDGGFGPLLDGDPFRPGDRAASDRGGVIGDRTGDPLGQGGMCRMEGQERTTAPQKSSTYWVWALSRRRASASLRLANLSVDRSASSSVRILAMVVAGAHTPREKTFRPFFSWTDPVFSGSLHPAGQGSVSGRKQHPTLRCRQDFAIG